MKRYNDGGPKSRFLSYELIENIATTFIYDGATTWNPRVYRVPTFERTATFLNVTCDGTWTLDVHDGMIVLQREDAPVTYSVPTYDVPPPANTSNTTNTTNLVYSHIEFFHTFSGYNNSACEPHPRFDQVRPKPTELLGFYRVNLEYFDESLAEVSLMDIPNLRDGFATMLAYATPDAFFTDARINETCSQACMNFEHDEHAMQARDGTGLCVTHEVQSLASQAIYGYDCRRPLNRTVVDTWTNATALIHWIDHEPRVYEKFYVFHGMFIYGKNETTCYLGNYSSFSDCVDMYVTPAYAAVLRNTSVYQVNVYGWNETDNRYSLSPQNYTFDITNARFVAVVGTLPHVSVYVTNGTQISGQYTTSVKTWRWRIGSSPGHRDSPRGSMARFTKITSVCGHGHRIYLIDDGMVRLVETMGTKVTTLLNVTGITDDTKVYVDDHYIYLWNHSTFSIYTEPTVIPTLALESSLMSTVQIQHTGALSIGDEYLYIFNASTMYMSDFRLFNLTNCFNDSLALDEEAELAAICVCDPVGNGTVCPDPDLNSSFRWRAQPANLFMGELYSRKVQTDRIGVYNDCMGVCATVGGQCIETLQLSASDFDLFHIVDGLQCGYVDSAARMHTFGYDTSLDVCFGITNDQQCTMKQHDQWSRRWGCVFLLLRRRGQLRLRGVSARRYESHDLHRNTRNGMLRKRQFEFRGAQRRDGVPGDRGARSAFSSQV